MLNNIVEWNSVPYDSIQILKDFYPVQNITFKNIYGKIDDNNYTQIKYVNNIDFDINTLNIENIDLSHANKVSGIIKNCYNLTSINMPNTAADYLIIKNCNNLSNIDSLFPIDNRIKINGCDSIKNIVLDDTLIAIDKQQFMNCHNLKNINLENIEKIGFESFCGCGFKSLKIYASVLNESCFGSCTELENVKICNNVIRMNRTFANCSKLSNIVLHDGLKTMIGTFEFCENLKHITLPTSVTKLVHAFDYCGLENIDLSKCTKLTNIGENCFAYCYKLKSVILPTTVKRIDRYAFELCTDLDIINLDNIEFINYCSFYNCKSLKVILTKCTEIKYKAFENCENLELVYNYASQLYIDKDVFKNCKNLKNIICNDYVKVRKNALYGCVKFDKIMANKIVWCKY